MAHSTRRDPGLQAALKVLTDFDAEEAVVAAILLDGDRFADVAQVRPSDFYLQTHAEVWRAFVELHKAKAPITLITVADELARIGSFEPPEGWGPRLTALSSHSEYAFNLSRHVGIVGDKSARRIRMNWLSNEATKTADPTQPIELPWEQGKLDVRVWCADEALVDPPPVEWIVKGLVSRGSLCVLYGEPGSKKTYAMIDLAVCVATGKKWLDYETVPRRVLFVDEESGERRLKERVHQALAGHLVGTVPGFSCISLAQIMLDETAGMGMLSSAISLAKAELVIIDALADVMSGDENAKKDVQPVMTSLRRTAEQTGAAIILIHHSNKLGGYRGSSAIKASPDLMVHVTSEPGSGTIHFKTEKNRDGLAGAWEARAVWVNGGDTPKQFYLEAKQWGGQAEEGAGSNRARVLAFLREAGECSLKQIQDGLEGEVGAEAVQRTVNVLKGDGLAFRCNPGERGTVARYALKQVFEEDALEEPDDG